MVTHDNDLAQRARRTIVWPMAKIVDEKIADLHHSAH